MAKNDYQTDSQEDLAGDHSAGTQNNSAMKTGRLTYAFAYAALVWERIWPLLVPLFITIIVFLTISWAGLWHLIWDWARWALLALFAGATLASLFPLSRFFLPRPMDVLRRIEKASGFEHRPVTAQVDDLANASDGDDPFAKALWSEHQARMARQMDNMSSGSPRPDGNLFDRYALRAIVPIFAFVALGYSFSLNGGRVMDAFQPRIDTKLLLSRLDVWLTPPAYSGRPPIYLSDIQSTPAEDADDDSLEIVASALSGSELTIRYVGDTEITARLKGENGISPLESQETSQRNAANQAVSYAQSLTDSVAIEILAQEKVIARWPVEITQDTPPTIMLTEPPGTALSGALELNYSVEDDYGVVSARGIISRLTEANPDARPLVEPPELTLPLPRARAKSGQTKVNRDFSSHPWAGSEVQLLLEATDDPGQTGTSEAVLITLPGRTFVDPMAKALMEQRRILALDANAAPLVANLIDAVTTHPEAFEIDTKAFLALQTAYRKTVNRKNDDELREAMDILWETALALELGDLSEVERKLREAQERLSEALENGASDEEIERLMNELRQAMNDYLEQLAREMAENPIEQNPLSNLDNSQMLTEHDLERMMQRIEDLAKSGSKDAARELLAEMQRMMDNLRAGQHQQQRQQEGNQLNQALDKLSELMQKQQQLMDETFSMQRREPQSGQQDQQSDQQQGDQRQSQNEQQQGEGEQPMTPEEFAEALRQLQEQQEALEQQLGELGQQLEDLGLDPSQEFGEAGQEMAEAGRNLGKGNTGEAAGDQGQALDALRRGAQSMMQQMAGDRNQGGAQPGQQGQNGQQSQRQTDPLGRRNEANGQVNDGSTRIPGEIDAQRAREIMEAIRKRLSDPLRPLLERNYLERLLNSR